MIYLDTLFKKHTILNAPYRFLRPIRCIGLLLLAFTLQLNAQNSPNPHEFIVQLSSQAKANKVFLNTTNYELISSNFNIYKVNSSKHTLGDFLKQTAVIAAQYNYKVTIRTEENIPDDNDFSLQWNMEYIEATKAWNTTTGGLTPNGDTIVVAIIDAGADFNHQDLKDNLWHNYNEIPNDGIDNDGNGYIDDFNGWRVIQGDDNHDPSFHGTPIAGIIGAVGNNEIGVTGINWNTKVMILSGVQEVSEIVEAYDYIYTMRQLYNETNGTKGAYIVATNISIGINNSQPSQHPIWCGVYDPLGEIGILNIAATANLSINVDIDGDVPTGCPSDYLLTVTNTDRGDTLRATAAYGKKTIDLAAPGSGVYTVFPLNGYNTFGGTSSAAPHVAGATGLLYSLPDSKFGNFLQTSPSQVALVVKEMLIAGVDTNFSLLNKTVSDGRLNLWKSMQLMEEYFEGFQEELQIVTVFPNPSHDYVTAKYDIPRLDWVNIQVTNALGQIVETIELTPSELGLKRVKIDVRRYQTGIYYLTLYSDGNKITTSFMVY